MFLAIFATAFSFSAFSQREITINPGEQAIVKTTPCPSNPIVVTNTDPVRPTQPVWKQLTPPKRDRIVYVKDNPSTSNTSTTTNSNNVTFIINSTTPAAPVVHDHGYFYEDNGLLWLLLLLALFLLGYYLIKRSTTPPVVTHPAPVTPTVIRTPAPAVVTPASIEEIEKGMAHAKSVGGTFMKGRDGGYTINFPKPTVEDKRKEEVQQQ